MTDVVCRPGEQEAFKLAIHLALFGLAMTCGLYAATAWLGRHERHLALNVVGYAAIVAFEATQIKRHVGAL
jgi:hypothetical protein